MFQVLSLVFTFLVRTQGWRVPACDGIPDSKAKVLGGQGRKLLAYHHRKCPEIPEHLRRCGFGAKVNPEKNTVQITSESFGCTKQGTGGKDKGGHAGQRRYEVHSSQTDILLKQRL